MLEGTVFKIMQVFFPEPKQDIQSQVHNVHPSLHDVGMQTFKLIIPLLLCAVQSLLASSFKCNHVLSAPNAQYYSTAMIWDAE